LAGVELSRVPEAWLRTVAPWFQPPADIPVFTGKRLALMDMSDAALIELLARHPLALAALAESAHTTVAEVESRLEPLIAAKRVALETRNGVLMVRAVLT
jgi:hypothetical protein